MTPHFHRGEQVDALTRYARLATLFPASNGQAFAAIPTGAVARQVCPIASAVFKDWLIENFIKEYETAPAPSALRQALGAAEALALCGDIPPQKVNRRVAAIGDPYEPTKIVIDLADGEGQTTEITGDGWRPGTIDVWTEETGLNVLRPESRIRGEDDVVRLAGRELFGESNRHECRSV